MRAAIAALLLIAAVSGAAHAQFVTRQFCDPTDDDIHEANRVIAEIEEMERAIIEALRKQTGQLAGYDAQGAAAVTQALDSQTRLIAQVLREVEESEATRAYQPTGEGCRTTTGVAGLGPGRANADAILSEAAVRDSGRISQDLGVVAPGGEARDTARRFDAIRTTGARKAAPARMPARGRRRTTASTRSRPPSLPPRPSTSRTSSTPPARWGATSPPRW